jgi:hypothetical protein
VGHVARCIVPSMSDQKPILEYRGYEPSRWPFWLRVGTLIALGLWCLFVIALRIFSSKMGGGLVPRTSPIVAPATAPRVGGFFSAPVRSAGTCVQAISWAHSVVEAQILGTTSRRAGAQIPLGGGSPLLGGVFQRDRGG